MYYVWMEFIWQYFTIILLYILYILSVFSLNTLLLLSNGVKCESIIYIYMCNVVCTYKYTIYIENKETYSTIIYNLFYIDIQLILFGYINFYITI